MDFQKTQDRLTLWATASGCDDIRLFGQGSGERAQAVLTGEVEEISCGLVISSIGYKSLPIDPTVPFDSRRAVVPNSVGRVHQAAGLSVNVDS